MGDYCEIAVGSVSNRNIIIPASLVLSRRVPGQELYRSLYSYDASIAEYVKLNGSVRGYAGVRSCDRLIFDVDRAGNSYRFTVEKVLTLCQRLETEFGVAKDNIQIYFSGTGFHVATPDFVGFTPSADLPGVMSATLMPIFEPLIDDIYKNPTRIIRVNGTINLKSMLYKVRLDPAILTDQELVLKLAQNNTQWEPPLPTPHFGTRSELIRDPAPTSYKGSEKPGLSLIKPTRYVTCMQKLYNLGEQMGERHISILRMSSAFRRAGVPQKGILGAMQEWAPSMDPQEIKHVVAGVFSNDYQYGCRDPIMMKYCDPECVFYKGKNYAVEYYNSHMLENKFKTFVQGPLSRKLFDLSEIFPSIGTFQFLPGELIVIWGDTGLGKSSLAQYICTKLPDQTVLYVSLEMDEYLTYRRFVQIAHGMTKEQVYDFYRTGNDGLEEALRHVRITTTPLHVDRIGQAALDANAQIVVVDTADGLLTNEKDESARIGEIAIGLKDLAIRQGIIIIVVHHISKFAAWKLEEDGLTLHSGKGSSTLEQKADKVIGIERMIGNERKITALKARDEKAFRAFLEFHPETFRFTERPNDKSVSG